MRGTTFSLGALPLPAKRVHERQDDTADEATHDPRHPEPVLRGRRRTEEQERAFNEQLERERAHAEGSAELEEVWRERDMMRQRNSRLCRKYGLKGQRERKGMGPLE